MRNEDPMQHDPNVPPEDPLEIRDSDRSTRGGPPGWMVFAIILGAAVLIGVTVIAIGLLS